MFVYISGSDYGAVVASTLPGAACTASATMPDGRRMELGARSANDRGVVTWSYPPKSPVAPGVGYHTVTCRLAGRSATGSAAFQPGS